MKTDPFRSWNGALLNGTAQPGRGGPKASHGRDVRQKKKTKLLLATALTLLVAYHASHAQIITNGSFESPVVDESMFATPTSWAWNRDVVPYPGRIMRGAFILPPQDGNQFVRIFAGGGPRFNRLSQTLVLTNPGPYKLRWHDSIGSLGGGFALYSVAVLNGPAEVVGQTNGPSLDPEWAERILRFSANAGTYTLEFRNEAPAAGGADSSLDNVSLEPDLPHLSIERMAGNVRVSWPLPADGFLLEEVGALTSSPVTGWTAVSTPYATNATHISVTLPASAERKFYRLHKP